MGTTKKHLKLSKVLKGRENWRERSNQNQAEKRKLQDKNPHSNGFCGKEFYCAQDS